MSDGRENEAGLNKGKRIGEYFQISPFFAGGLHGLELENQENLVSFPIVMLGPPVGQKYGFGDFSEKPVLRPNKKSYKNPPKDFEQFHSYWLVSRRVKSVLEKFDPESVSFVECDVFHISGKPLDPEHYLCDVVRKVDALDEVNSKVVRVVDGDGDRYSLTGDQEVNFNIQKLGGAHIFRQNKMTGIYCDAFLRREFLAAGVTNTAYFKDVSIRK
ncbi:hypothetical protein J2T09_003699 [Neorhizobium huautlense]|uniref:Immunity MXAN-0049 protein domain-containing protein n=1 Tax=Neorhizobium huautlense TaxID=67774 RepID=A0ABT9PX00_9HYPH|nr:DUF1629 domain-containing protein [Neorhizobium huautlense]MDP9838927.1 hypothetical protein [Neorhizobium huautlense]